MDCDYSPIFQSKTKESDIYDEFVEFSNLQYATLDYDPFHPMLVKLQENLEEEESLWMSTLYMAFYNIGSCYFAFLRNPKPLSELDDVLGKLPIGLQRRNLRGGEVIKYFHRFRKKVKPYGSIKNFLTHNFTGSKEKDWFILLKNLNSVWGNGRWASFTLGEIFQKVNKLPVLPTDIMNENSSGPRTGLELLMGKAKGKTKKEKLADLKAKADALFRMVRPRIKTNIFYLPKNHYDYGMMESQLCDFNSMTKGLYYTGRDIDRDLERIIRTLRVAADVGIDIRPAKRLWEIRREVFPSELLGELHGWYKRHTYAKKFYKNFGIIAKSHKEIRDYLGIWREDRLDDRKKIARGLW